MARGHILFGGPELRNTAKQVLAIFSNERIGLAGMNANDPIYLELVDFVAGGTTPEDVANYHPSAEAQKRITELIGLERESRLTTQESAELTHFLELEHILRMAKAKARLILATRS